MSYSQSSLVPRHLFSFLHTSQQAKRKEREDDSLSLAERIKSIRRKNTPSLTVDEATPLIESQLSSSLKGRLQKSPVRTCSFCAGEKTGKNWYKNPTTGLLDRCKACYDRVREERTKTCSSCGKIKTVKNWYQNLITTGLVDRCTACYRQARKK
jgi:RNA polymerase subunit RPABC4/transcription elongation factor Spt4